MNLYKNIYFSEQFKCTLVHRKDLDFWFDRFSIGFDYFRYDGLPMLSIRLGWLWISYTETIDVDNYDKDF